MVTKVQSWLIPLRFVAFLWLVKIIELVTGFTFAGFGIYPRNIFGLIGVLFAPLIHGDIYHLLSNSIPIIILGTALFLLYPKVAYGIFLACYYLTNIMVWVFARPSLHIGASGLLYGIAFFLMTIGFFRKDFKSLIVSIVVAFFYSSIVFGIFPIIPGVSWESHLMGALVGIVCASSLSKNKHLNHPDQAPSKWY